MDAYFNCFSGISGNMVLGALFDLGLDKESWQQKLNKLGIADEYSLNIEKVNRSGISGQHVQVEVANNNHNSDHNSSQNSRNSNHHLEEPEARHLDDIEKLLADSELSAEINEKIWQIFKRLAAAEGRVHDLPPEEVHFHEVGAVDAIVDIAGAVIGLDMLEIENIVSSPLHTGTGFIECAHGRLPVPAPAVLELLSGVPAFSEGIDTELVTPTGAAIITTLADEFAEMPAMTINSSGYGAGSKKLEIPNLLRITTGEFSRKNKKAGTGNIKQALENHKVQQVTKISTNIDDMNPEHYQHVMDRLLSAGALDVYIIPVYMKKNRPGHILNVLCAEDEMEKLSAIIMEETTSLGVRVEKSISRICLQRDITEVETSWGNVRIKVAYNKDKIINAAPEYEDCRALAREHGIPLKKVYNAAHCKFENQRS